MTGRLAEGARELLRRYPTDADLWAGFERLRERRFVPPQRAELPKGPLAQVRQDLDARDGGELAALAATLVTLPDAQLHTSEAGAALELLLTLPNERDRALRLHAQLAEHADPGEHAVWGLRLRLEELPTEATAEDIEAALAPCRGVGGSALHTGLHLAASWWLGGGEAYGVTWLTPVCRGRFVANAGLALARRPDLADELGPVAGWLAEAATLVPAADEPLLRALHEAERADRARAHEAGTEALVEALRLSGERVDLGEALHARGQALLDPALVARAESIPGVDADAGDRAAISAGRAASLEPPATPAPRPAEDGWSSAILRLGETPATARWTSEPDLALAEACGSLERAALGWLERGGRQDLLHSCRLARHLGAAEGELLRKLDEVVPADEEALARDPQVRALALWYQRLAPDPLREIRLRAAMPQLAEPTSAIDLADEDPHSVANRLAAAADLVGEGHLDAAAHILASLARKAAAPEDLTGFARLTAAVLQNEAPPEALVQAAQRLLSDRSPAAGALLDALCADPGAAYALHEPLRAEAGAAGAPDGWRTRCIEAWLGIWHASATAPGAEALRGLMRSDVALLPLAASRIAHAPDPISAAAAFVAAHPAGTTSPNAYGDALLAACAG